MNKLQPTSGDWDFTLPVPGDADYAPEPMAIYPVDDDDVTICWINQDLPEAMANARLIAASKKLLAALERVMRRWESHDGQLDTIDDVREAINSAKGESK